MRLDYVFIRNMSPDEHVIESHEEAPGTDAAEGRIMARASQRERALWRKQSSGYCDVVVLTFAGGGGEAVGGRRRRRRRCTARVQIDAWPSPCGLFHGRHLCALECPWPLLTGVQDGPSWAASIQAPAWPFPSILMIAGCPCPAPPRPLPHRARHGRGCASAAAPYSASAKAARRAMTPQVTSASPGLVSVPII